jgi:hypothetical protein
MDTGWDADGRAFVQRDGRKVLDASLLRMVHVGIVSPTDPRTRAAGRSGEQWPVIPGHPSGGCPALAGEVSSP